MLIKNKTLIALTSLLLLLSTQWACQSNGGGETPDPCQSELDQTTLFQNLADQLIIPRYEDFQNLVNDLQLATEDFLSNPDLNSLSATQEVFKETYKRWQYVAQYQFGPAEEVGLRMSVNNFPADVALIQSNINSGKTDFSQPESFDRGLPAIDFLLFGVADSEDAIVALFTDDSAVKDHYHAYLQNSINDIKAKTDEVVKKWTKEGFRESFLAATGTAAGASLSQIINGLNEHYEFIRREKLGIPVGALTLGFTNPEKSEAFFSGISLELAIAATQAAQEFYLGQGADGVNREGLDDYLQQISEKSEGAALHQTIDQQFKAALTALGGLADPLANTIESNKSAVEAAYAEIVKQVVNIKTDMPSLLCIAITYVDNPSDSD